MIDRFTEGLTEEALSFLTTNISKVRVTSLHSTRMAKNPASAYESESFSIGFDLAPVSPCESIPTILDGGITMSVAFLEEAHLLIGLLTSGVMVSPVYKVKKFNHIEKFNRLVSSLTGSKREPHPLMKVTGAEVE